MLPLVLLVVLVQRTGLDRLVGTGDDPTTPAPTADATLPALADDGRRDLAAPVSAVCIASTSVPVTVTVGWVMGDADGTWVGVGAASPRSEDPTPTGYVGPTPGVAPSAYILVGGERLAADIVEHPGQHGAYPSCSECPPHRSWTEGTQSPRLAFRFPRLPTGTSAFTLEISDLPPCTLVEPLRIDVALRPHAEREAEAVRAVWEPVAGASVIAAGFGITVTEVAYMDSETVVLFVFGPAGGGVSRTPPPRTGTAAIPCRRWLRVPFSPTSARGGTSSQGPPRGLASR